MPALALQFSQMLLLQLCGGDCLRPHYLAKSAQHLCIDSIGLGQNTSRSRKLPHPVGLNQTDFEPCTSKRLDESSLVAAARFTDHLHGYLELFNPFNQLSMTNRIIRETAFLIPQRPVRIRLRDIKSHISFT